MPDRIESDELVRLAAQRISQDIETDGEVVEKRYPYKTPAPALCGVLVVLGALVTGSCLFLGWGKDSPVSPGIALIAGISVAGCVLALVLIMRMLRPPYLILSEDGISFPGRPKKGWWVAFADVEEVRVHPPFLGYRMLDMKAQSRPWSKAEEERWWSVSERMLPTKDAFDEVCSYILAHVECASPEQKLDHPTQ